MDLRKMNEEPENAEDTQSKRECNVSGGGEDDPVNRPAPSETDLYGRSSP